MVGVHHGYENYHSEDETDADAEEVLQSKTIQVHQKVDEQGKPHYQHVDGVDLLKNSDPLELEYPVLPLLLSVFRLQR